MRFYLSAASAEVAMAAEWIRRLEAAGHECTCDWTVSVLANAGKTDADLSDSERYTFACADIDGVDRAEVFWLLVPPPGRSAGAWLELGYAMGRPSCQVVVSGDLRRSIFIALADVALDTHEAAFDFIIGRGK